MLLRVFDYTCKTNVATLAVQQMLRYAVVPYAHFNAYMTFEARGWDALAS
jgi:hypothetical protein